MFSRRSRIPRIEEIGCSGRTREVCSGLPFLDRFPASCIVCDPPDGVWDLVQGWNHDPDNVYILSAY